MLAAFSMPIAGTHSLISMLAAPRRRSPPSPVLEPGSALVRRIGSAPARRWRWRRVCRAPTACSDVQAFPLATLACHRMRSGAPTISSPVKIIIAAMSLIADD